MIMITPTLKKVVICFKFSNFAYANTVYGRNYEYLF